MGYLKKNKVFIESDNFLRNDSVNPGFFVNIHPTLVRKDDFAQEITNILQGVDIEDLESCKSWIEEHT
eukprot:3637343-Ditylum_brightwellii.AAC.1